MRNMSNTKVPMPEQDLAKEQKLQEVALGYTKKWQRKSPKMLELQA